MDIQNLSVKDFVNFTKKIRRRFTAEDMNY